MKIAAGLEMMEIESNLMGRRSIVHPVLIWDDETAVLVDTGFPGQTPLILSTMNGVGVPLSRLDKIIITHQDIDHIGGLADILKASKHKIEVISHEIEKPYIQGDKKLVKSSPENLKRFDTMPEEMRNKMKAVFMNPPKAPVDKTVGDGEELPYCGGIVAIFTPGHTPGHICLYLRKYKTLITGDALNIVEGKLTGPNSWATYDMGLAIDSLKKLARYDIEKTISYHGGLYDADNINESIAGLADHPE